MSIGIYKITSPTNRVYIGQSTNIQNRWSRNYNSLSCKKQIKLYNSLFKHGIINHDFEIIEECTIEQLDEREIYWKQYYLNQLGWSKMMFCKLIDGKGGYMSDETKQKISLANKGNKNRIGVKMSKGQKNKMSKSHKGKILSLETKQKISNSNKGKIKHTLKSKEKISNSTSTSVIQYDLEGNFIQEWPSIKKASNSLINKIGTHNIIHNCKGRQKTAGGFIWKYK